MSDLDEAPHRLSHSVAPIEVTNALHDPTIEGTPAVAGAGIRVSERVVVSRHDVLETVVDEDLGLLVRLEMEDVEPVVRVAQRAGRNPIVEVLHDGVPTLATLILYRGARVPSRGSAPIVPAGPVHEVGLVIDQPTVDGRMIRSRVIRPFVGLDKEVHPAGFDRIEVGHVVVSQRDVQVQPD
jgi:hypothetical protein